MRKSIVSKMIAVMVVLVMMVGVVGACSASAESADNVEASATAEDATTPEVTESAAEAATTSNAVESTVPEGEKSEETSNDFEGYTCSPEDYLMFTYGDGKTQRIHLEGENAVYEMVEDGQTLEEGAYSIEGNNSFINYIVEKYFYAAKAAKEGLPSRDSFDFSMDDYLYGVFEGILSPEEIEEMKEQDAAEDTVSLFEWSAEDELVFTFSDGTTYKMSCENDMIKVGCVEDGNTTEILTFGEDEKAETEDFIDRILVGLRVDSDDEFRSFIMRNMFSQ